MEHLNLARAILKGAWGTASPVYVQFAVTKRCNLRCRMCNSNLSRGRERELALDEIERLAGVVAQMGVGVFIITGGEPFMRKDLVEVYRAFVAQGIVPRLQTNGILAEEAILRKLVDLGLREVTLSLDSLEEARQDEINGQPGAWRRTIEALALFSRVLPRKANMSGVNIVVSKRNLHEVVQVVEFVDAIGFYASLIPVHVSSDSDPDFIIRKAAAGFGFGPEDSAEVDKLYSDLLEMKSRGVRVQNSVRFLRECPEFLVHGRTQWTCTSPRLFFSISPGGGFLPCVDVPYQRTMLDEPFLADYRSGRLAQEIAPLVAQCPGCMYACWPEVTYACSHFRTLVERGVQAARVRRDERPQMSAEDMLALASRLREQQGGAAP